MTKATAPSIDEQLEEYYNDELSEEDYGFVLGPDGELKSVFLPDSTPFKAPKNVAKILKIFGIHDIDNISKDEPLH
jgi:hypothetical protein